MDTCCSSWGITRATCHYHSTTKQEKINEKRWYKGRLSRNEWVKPTLPGKPCSHRCRCPQTWELTLEDMKCHQRARELWKKSSRIRRMCNDDTDSWRSTRKSGQTFQGTVEAQRAFLRPSLMGRLKPLLDTTSKGQIAK